MLDFAFDGVALILNLLINILVLGFFLDYDLLVAYAVGFLLVEFLFFTIKIKYLRCQKYLKNPEYILLPF